VLTLRPAVGLPPLEQLRALPWCREIALRGLTSEAISALASYQLGLKRLPAELSAQLEAQSAGNPQRLEMVLRELRAYQGRGVERVVGG
jgi:hypothetical protein